MDGVFLAVRDFGALTFVALWILTASWLRRDAVSRCGEQAGRLALAAGIVLPFVAPALHAFVRPSEKRLDVRERRLRRRMLEAELDPGERCLACRTPLRPDFLRCPGCGIELRDPCRGCGELLRFGWNACPHCEAHVAPRPLRVAA